ncbi:MULTISPECIES: aspartate carbamoyltransferase catalytic subunit [Oceanicaulis]|jgi:aspartate carbamoyltransferase catalytic subunit|uniref:aspartate carbamoyltransferase catalytic subunit n=1 Tax=Oceanicaulis TaxID=153232 RepID=UPI0003B50C5C|nr:aspartate carbamoyltransferase catalytic subunit [Oceanicaulis alexandrii]MBL4539737.1 aspartate carbamoyltransferase catalytic subunit [Oceanicaulis sp.]
MERTGFAYDFPHDSLLSVGDLNPLDVQMIFERARHHFDAARRGDKQGDTLKGLTQINLFFENSTRTLASFEIAAKRLGADVVNFAAGSASISKGESLDDTALTLAAMRPDVLVVRHKSAGAAAHFARVTGVPTVNAGDGAHEHPTQALLDAFTLTRRWGEVGGRRILIVGDILHSRVARSNVSLLNLLNAEVRLCGPATLLPADADRWGVTVFHDLEEALEGCDAVMALRIQKERMTGGLIPSDREYAALWGLNEARLERASPDCLVMHPGPMNRGVEIDGALADDPDRAVILDQVESGVAVRSAILELITGRAPNGAIADMRAHDMDGLGDGA